MSQFATAADLAELLGETFDATRTAQANSALELASAAIQAWTRQQIEHVAGDTASLRGVWDDELPLPERPVTAVTSVTYDGDQLVVDDDYELVGSVLRRDNGWGGPGVAVVVVYDHGWDPIPDPIRAVALQVASRMMATPQGVSAESIGTYSVTYGEAMVGSGVEGYTALLAPYRRRAGTLRIGQPSIGGGREDW